MDLADQNTTEAAAALWTPPKPPAELKQLDFLLGSYTCTGKQHMGESYADETGKITLLTTTTTTMDGHIYQMDATWPGVLRGRWLFGWNPIDSLITAYYLADSGSQGTATSTGWQDEKISFVGDYAIAVENSHPRMRDDFMIIDDDNYYMEEYTEVDGKWQLLVSFECRRQDTTG